MCYESVIREVKDRKAEGGRQRPQKLSWGLKKILSSLWGDKQQL